MAKKKEIKPDSVKIFYHDDILTNLPSVPGCKSLSAALINLFRNNQCKAIVSTWKDRVEYKFRFHQFNNYDCGHGSIFVTVYFDLNRISIAIVGKNLTDTAKSQLLIQVPGSVRTMIVRSYKHRQIKTLESIIDAANYIRKCLNDIDYSNDNINMKKRYLDRMIH